MSTLYLIPVTLNAEAFHTIPPYAANALQECRAIFAENEKTARRFVYQLYKFLFPGKPSDLNHWEWFTLSNDNESLFLKKIKEEKNVALLSEAGCPCIADPGHPLVLLAHKMNIPVKPLVGPGSVFLALMASGLNGQHFRFSGYLPVNTKQRVQKIKELETEALQKKCTQIFMETPYRNNQLLNDILRHGKPHTLLCIACNLTAPNENITTRTIAEWKKNPPDLHKQPCIFCLGISA
ncbi:MAG: SAM-dependent methyltransferase [Chitinophagaceae bacterium]|nr:SAM-dependent methyltransferase [Chitinophagaceae bacterium]